ncbi:uncharacterized protein LOC111636869 [Centruroides sculpturatus]|uniref:uncharacterized protein LOC111636869 n=1 Tax=Centruroides sculpturatus TaxID=218467 RepID=UPI000C6EBA39|nr:uncharacterized protein LOC111636869 [Centruroides sculpturatus]
MLGRVGRKAAFGRITGLLVHDNWFIGSRIYWYALRFIYVWSQELYSLDFCKVQIGLDFSTIVDWNSYMREVCANSLMNHCDGKIGGVDKIVEIDETMYTRKYNVGRVLPLQWVFGQLCRETKECFLVPVPNRSAETLLREVVKHVNEGTTIYSDCWKGYNTKQLQEASYFHYQVNHKLNFVNADSGCHTHNVERLWGSCKKQGPKRYFASSSQLVSYRVYVEKREPKKEAFTAILRDIAKFMLPKIKRLLYT